MKQNVNVLAFLLILICIVLGETRLWSQSSIKGLKKGDWFDCEMEFEEGGFPVFHNHYILKEDKKEYLAYVTVRFTYMGKKDQSSEWDYKVLRYKLIQGYEDMFNKSTDYKLENLYSLDTWYPDFFFDGYDSIRNLYQGKLYIEGDTILKHEFLYDAKYLTCKSVVSVTDLVRRNVDGYYPDNINSGNKLSGYVENMAMLMFNVRSKNPDTFIHTFEKGNDESVSGQEKKVTIRHRYNSRIRKRISSYLLVNGLPYAFKDEHLHKVYAITKASFNIPNNAVINITNKRKNSEEFQFPNLIKVEYDNQAFIVNESGEHSIIPLESGKVSKKIELKSGTSLNLKYGKASVNVYVEPGDTVNITFNDNDEILISNSLNNIWWKNHPEPAINEIDGAFISPEFKSYLKLQNEINSVAMSLKTMDRALLQRSILKFYGLKSYHYNGLSNSLIVLYSANKKEMEGKLLSFKPSLRYYYYYEALNNTDFLLYFYLNRFLTGQFAFDSILERKSLYSDYLNICGDTLINKGLSSLFDIRKAILKGKHFPFERIFNNEHQYLKKLPANNKYCLVCLSNAYNDRDNIENDFDILKDSLNEDVQTVYYYFMQSNLCNPVNEISDASSSKSIHYTLYGYPTVISKLISPMDAILILFDEDGKIVYSKLLNNQQVTIINGIQISNANKYAEEINEAIQKDKQQNKSKLSSILFIVLVSTLVVAIIAFAVFRIVLYRVKKKNEQLRMIQELKMKSVQSQLNPHFIFNALNSIQQLIYASQTKMANKYLLGFSVLLRGVLDNSDKRLVSLSEELNIIRQYCELEKLRFDFDFTLDQSITTSEDIIEVPYMLLQPVVENSIKHGISKMESGGEVRIQIKEENSLLTIKILDNGPGFKIDPLQNPSPKGKGLKLMLDKLKSSFDNDYEFRMRNQPEVGAEVFIQFKIG